jgi:hypothetical protein
VALISRKGDMIVVTGDEMTWMVGLDLARRIGMAAGAAEPAPQALSSGGRLTLDEDHFMWRIASGGNRDDPRVRWRAGDEELAAIAWTAYRTKARTILSVLTAVPGAAYTTDELAAATGLYNRNALAAALHGFTSGSQLSKRTYPFSWWKDKGRGAGSLYATRPSVAALFAGAMGTHPEPETEEET